MQVKDSLFLKDFLIGFEFEFYSNLNPFVIKSKFKEEFRKDMFIPYAVVAGGKSGGFKDSGSKSSGDGKSSVPSVTSSGKTSGYYGSKTSGYSGKSSGDNKEILMRSDFEPTSEVFKLERDHSGDKIYDGKVFQMFEIITGPMEYNEAKLILIRMLKFISNIGWTTNRASLHINISYAGNVPHDQRNIRNIDKLKLCLSIDENYIYKLFPERKNNLYAQSIKSIRPNNPFVSKENVTSILRENYSIPSTKYYGVNFEKLMYNYLEFRYIGGENYEKKVTKIIELFDYFIGILHTNLYEYNYTSKNLDDINTILKKHNRIVQSFSDLNSFLRNYPKIYLTYDMKSDYEVIKTFYSASLRQDIYNLIVYCGMKDGYINYDSDIGKLQVKDAILNNCSNISGYELISCKLNNGLLDGCDFINCVLDGCHITKSEMVEHNIIKNCKMEDVPIYTTNKLEGCYIQNSNIIMEGVYKNCIIRSGRPSKKNSTIIDCVISEDPKSDMLINSKESYIYIK